MEGLSSDFFEDIRISLQEFVQKALASFIDSEAGVGQVGSAVLRVDASVLQPERSGNHTLDQAVLIEIDLSSLSEQSSEDESATVRANSGALRPLRQRRNASSLSPSASAETLGRRKHTGGLRLGESSPKLRRLNADGKVFPQRRKQEPELQTKMEPSTVEKLIRGIWEQIHGSLSFDLHHVIEQWHEAQRATSKRLISDVDGEIEPWRAGNPLSSRSFKRMNQFCHRMTQASRSCRALEVIVQAQWVQSFDERVDVLNTQNHSLSPTECRMRALAEACQDFDWSEKELRNKMAIWRGYKEIQEAAGWTALVFAGMGLYRFCKYRTSFTPQSMKVLQNMRSRIEVAADTIHPKWRQMLAIVGEDVEPVYQGHPHDWVVARDQEPVPLATTYLQWDADFSFEHLDEPEIDKTTWGQIDPREVVMGTSNQDGCFICENCEQVQSGTADNKCRCFPDLFGSSWRKHCPVQVFRTDNGRNNGLMACLPFDRDAAIGEFVGLITSGISNLDVMQGSTDTASYQIYQGSKGNYTRFVNHSCTPNSQFERFVWLGIQRVILVSRGIDAGSEITVDYSDEYWAHLNKKCLCGASSCRYDRAT